uniref:Tumor necrosis factor alpha-induced protein 2-like n=1 Tax=Poecilia latipinna TaxID=48699 RepID=A0A3B3V6G4_9TELE
MRLPKMKIPAKIWRHRKHKNQHGGQNLQTRAAKRGGKILRGLKERFSGKKKTAAFCVSVSLPADDQPDGGHEEEEEEQQEEERLDDLSRKLILREEELFTQDGRSEEEEDRLLKDFESLSVRVWMAVHSSFVTTATPAGRPDVLRSAVDTILQQETQDQRWTERPADSAPVWRPLRWLRTHNLLLQKMVEKQLKDAEENETGDTGQLSSVTKRQVCRLGKRVKEDLLTAAEAVRHCYPSRMDVLNIYGGLYHQAFAARLAQLCSSELDLDDCSYLLFWVNHYYPDEILKHKELDGIKTACLGSLLQPETLGRLEEQYLSHRQEKVKLWLSTALKKEEESWLSGKTPELIDCYYFSPLAIDVIQVSAGTGKITDDVEHFLLQWSILFCYQLWTPPWVDGSLPVVDQLLSFLSQQLADLSDLKPACKQVRRLRPPPVCLATCPADRPRLSAAGLRPPPRPGRSVHEEDDEDQGEEPTAAGGRVRTDGGRRQEDGRLLQRAGETRSIVFRQ